MKHPLRIERQTALYPCVQWKHLAHSTFAFRLFPIMLCSATDYSENYDRILAASLMRLITHLDTRYT